MKQTLGKRSGFTLVELIITISVIGILVTIGIVSWSSAQTRAKKNSFQANSEQVKLKLGEYFTDNNRYPKDKTTACSYLTSINASTLQAEFCTGPNNAAYVYAGSATAAPPVVSCYNASDTPTNTPACATYTITVAKTSWGGGSSDTDIVVKN
jgi:prepilin-type N-terminal cleavage/methylation domain-containing protein